jgi:hypothetical protein
MHAALAGQPVQVEQPDPSTFRIRGLGAEQVGHLAFAGGVELHELRADRFDLEDLFFALTAGGQQGGQQGGQPGGPPGAPGGLPPAGPLVGFTKGGPA